MEKPVVVITGISRGIGLATAKKFAAEGWQVVGTSTSGHAADLADNVHCFAMDLKNPKSIASAARAITNHYPKINVIVNNAGTHFSLRNDMIDPEVLRQTLEVNVIGSVEFTNALLPHLVDGGKIINVASGAASLTGQTAAYAPEYAISKTALNMVTKKWAVILANRNIFVASIDPGWVRTDMGGQQAPRDPSEPADEISQLATTDHQTGLFWHQNKERAW